MERIHGIKQHQLFDQITDGWSLDEKKCFATLLFGSMQRADEGSSYRDDQVRAHEYKKAGERMALCISYVYQMASNQTDAASKLKDMYHLLGYEPSITYFGDDLSISSECDQMGFLLQEIDVEISMEKQRSNPIQTGIRRVRTFLKRFF